MDLEKILFKDIIYRFIYSLRGEDVMRHLPLLSKNSNKSTDQIANEQIVLLRNTALHCYENILFYKKRFDDAGFNVNKKWQLDEFARQVPILEKDELRTAFQNININASRGQLGKRQTSGSTGNPLILYKDMEATSFIDAAMLRNFHWYGVDIGDRRAHFWGGGSDWQSRLHFYCRDLLTNWRRFNCFELSEHKIQKYHNLLKRFHPRYIYGYAKCIYEFVRFSIELGLAPNFPKVFVIVITGEKITASQKKEISKYFQAPVAEEYGCTECGVIAFECSEGGMHIMSDILHVETVNSQEVTVSEDAGNIVLTELRGTYFPLLRYKIGDMGLLSKCTCTCGCGFPLIENIQGREDDYIVCVDGTKIDAYCIEYSIKKIPRNLGAITQIQGTQNSPTAVEITVAGDFFNFDSWKTAFTKELSKYLGEITINVFHVDTIPREQSGKLRFFKSSISNNR